ncbi:MAG: M4 family metallopeptidase [Fulvivirga sp.]
MQGTFNEGMSDIWAAILEQRINPNSTWRIGEQVTLNFTHLRNLQETNHSSAQSKMTDTFQSTQYNNSTNLYARSGVFSHWFYVLVNGESGFNGVSEPYSVDGIGFDDAEAIMVEAVFNNYLDGTTSYPAVRTSMVNAAAALFGNCSVQYIATVNAWHAVGVGTPTGSPITGEYTYYGGTYLVTGSGGVGVSGSTTIYITLSDYGSSVYNWSISSKSGNASASFNGRNAYMTLGSGGRCNITCQVSTSCGTESFSFGGYNYSSYSFTAYPNPADETLTISVNLLEKGDSENTLVEAPDSAEPALVEFPNISVKLFSEKGLVVASEKLKNTKCVLDTKNIPTGQYFLHIGKGKNKIIKQILIEH